MVYIKFIQLKKEKIDFKSVDINSTFMNFERYFNKNYLEGIFLGSKITAGGDCNHGIKRHLLLGRRAMTNLTVY